MAASLTWSVSGTTADAASCVSGSTSSGGVGLCGASWPDRGPGWWQQHDARHCGRGAAVLPALSDGDYAWLALLLQEVAEANPDRGCSSRRRLRAWSRRMRCGSWGRSAGRRGTHRVGGSAQGAVPQRSRPPPAAAGGWPAERAGPGGALPGWLAALFAQRRAVVPAVGGRTASAVRRLHAERSGKPNRPALPRNTPAA